MYNHGCMYKKRGEEENSAANCTLPRSIPDLTVLPIQGFDQSGLAKALQSVVLVYHLRISM